ncbi:hypothetical protein JCGZ_06744 [Jatropha curcas]|uniref:HSF-type DNA-binding domain-containing protein n=1 Tax=Jatropha curcas TaxID=180498 RepID=A0A067KYG2_JATCU|nr:heat stress transcription factor A-2c [Jatropha curcas]KDP37290.1 hypothetical protein JCGZ_06744 [Jatropha curcas]
MNPEDEKSSQSPHKRSDSSSASEHETTPSLLQPVMGSQGFPSGSLTMEDMNFAGSPISASFPSPLMELEAFSSMEQSVYSSSQMFEFEANPASETAPIGPSAGGDADDDAPEEDVGGMPRPLASLQENPVPPFLSKTYDLVNDRTLDPIISWGTTGESFVVWEPLEFARIILPRNFKHNNFSSFVRQLNTYGFRKIDSDKWEFANEAFRRGKRHLLKNIQRRKSPQTQFVGSYTGPSTEAGKSELQSEIERLRQERSTMMQEVVELQQQQRGAVHHMEAVNQRLKTAEQRQKLMVAFLAKLFQNPGFLARLRQNKERAVIGSSRMNRKFVKHQNQQHGPESPIEGQIANYRSELGNLPLSAEVPDINPAPIEQSPDYTLQGMVEMGEDAECRFEVENVASHNFVISDELQAAQGYINSQEQFGEGTSNFGSEDPQFKGKIVASPQQEVDPEYYVSFPVDLAAEKNFPEFSSGIDSIVRQEEVWSMGFDSQAGMSSSSHELWGNLVSYDVLEFGTSGGFSDIWDLGSVQAAGSSGVHKWPVDEPKSHAGQPEDDRSKNIDP